MDTPANLAVVGGALVKAILSSVMASPTSIQMFTDLTPDIQEEKRDAFEFFLRVFGRVRGKDSSFHLMGILIEKLVVGVRPMTDATVGTGKGRKKNQIKRKRDKVLAVALQVEVVAMEARTIHVD